VACVAQVSHTRTTFSHAFSPASRHDDRATATPSLAACDRAVCQHPPQGICTIHAKTHALPDTLNQLRTSCAPPRAVKRTSVEPVPCRFSLPCSHVHSDARPAVGAIRQCRAHELPVPAFKRCRPIPCPPRRRRRPRRRHQPPGFGSPCST